MTKTNTPKTPLSERMSMDMFGASADLPRIVEIDLSRIQMNPNQPRKHFDPVSLQELAQSIESNGLIQPILVRAIPDQPEHYEIVAGERRFRAHELLGKSTIAAVITNGNAAELAIVENLQREDLKPMELAESLEHLMLTQGYTQETLAKVIGKARTTLTELLSLNRLDETIKAECRVSDIANKSFLIQLAKLGAVEQLAAWANFKAGGTAHINTIGKLMSTTVLDTESAKGLKAKWVYHTKEGLYVVVQSKVSGKLDGVKIEQALMDAINARQHGNA